MNRVKCQLSGLSFPKALNTLSLSRFSKILTVRCFWEAQFCKFGQVLCIFFAFCIFDKYSTCQCEECSHQYTILMSLVINSLWNKYTLITIVMDVKWSLTKKTFIYSRTAAHFLWLCFEDTCTINFIAILTWVSYNNS